LGDGKAMLTDVRRCECQDRFLNCGRWVGDFLDHQRPAGRHVSRSIPLDTAPPLPRSERVRLARLIGNQSGPIRRDRPARSVVLLASPLGSPPIPSHQASRESRWVMRPLLSEERRVIGILGSCWTVPTEPSSDSGVGDERAEEFEEDMSRSESLRRATGRLCRLHCDGCHRHRVSMRPE
jgi:hypothetical protein